jgi:hypothetical protein
MSMLELAERVEIVSGGDRVMDAEIWRAVSNASPKDHWYKDFRGVHVTDHTIPEVTVSLDAAEILVPHGWNWMAGNRNQPLARAYVNNGELAFEGAAARRNPKREWYEVTAPSPARALTAAALRARHALALSKGSEG